MNGHDWFGAWVTHHFDRASGVGAPEPDTERGIIAYQALRSSFEREAIPEAAAYRATERVIVEAPGPKAHLRVLLRLARDAALARDMAPDEGYPASREESEARCRADHCECGGTGLVSRQLRTRRNPDGEFLPCYCSGVMGRWLAASHAHEDAIRGRIVDLAEVHSSRIVLPEEGIRFASVADMWRAIGPKTAFLKSVAEKEVSP